MKLQTTRSLGPLAQIAISAAATESLLAFPSAPLDDADDTRQILDTLRSDANSTKISNLNRVLGLSPNEGAKFWPVYREYERELGTLSTQKLAFLRDFVEQQSSRTRETAADLSKKWFSAVEERLALWKKYHEKISRAVSPVRAAQFLQVEHQISLFMDLNVASEMPLLASTSGEASP